MTAVVFIRRADAIVAASDGSVCDPDGRVVGFRSKLQAVPEWSMIMSARGHDAMLDSIRGQTRDAETFDRFIEIIPTALRKIVDHYREIVPNFHGTLVFAGLSESKGEFEGYRCSSSPLEYVDGETPEPYTMSPLPICYLAPVISDKLLGPFGLLAADNEEELAMRMICAARADQHKYSNGTGYGVGGFVQLMVATREKIETRIVHRWPDLIGEKIDPSRGEAMPAFLVPKAAA